MSTKLIIGKTTLDLPRGAVIPREGDIVRLTLRTETKEKIYAVHLVEHVFNFNGTTLPNTEITLKQVKNIEAD